MENKKNTNLSGLMQSTMEKVHEMVDTNTIVGQPITTPDGVTLIPVSKVSFGFGSGGGDYGKPAKDGFGGGSAARGSSSCFLRGAHCGYGSRCAGSRGKIYR